MLLQRQPMLLPLDYASQGQRCHAMMMMRHAAAAAAIMIRLFD